MKKKVKKTRREKHIHNKYLPKEKNPFWIENRESIESLCKRKASSLEFALNGWIEIRDSSSKSEFCKDE